MQPKNHEPVSKPVTRNGYDFRLEFNGLSFRADGSPVTGKETVYANGELVSSKRSCSILSEHTFSTDGFNYKLEFEVLDKLTGELACRLYCDDKMVKLFVASPKRLFFTKPLFFVSVIVALMVHDDIITSLSLSYVVVFMVLLVAIDIIYPMRHIWIMELEV